MRLQNQIAGVTTGVFFGSKNVIANQAEPRYAAVRGITTATCSSADG